MADSDLEAKTAKLATTVSPSSDRDLSDDSLPNGKYQWFRGAFFQATIVGISAFAAPGLWNAMNSVGAGGQQSPYLVMYATAFTKLRNADKYDTILY